MHLYGLAWNCLKTRWSSTIGSRIRYLIWR